MKTPDKLVNEHYQDRYFDVVNAIAEARHVYFEGCKILEVLHETGKLNIGETGFGAGRVLLSMLGFLDRAHANFAKEDAPEWEVEYATVELHPLSAERLANILSIFRGAEKDIDLWMDKLIAAYETFDIALHHCWQSVNITTNFGSVKLKLWCGEALEMVQEVTQRDVWFLEGHGPKSNPHIWRSKLLKAVGEQTRTGGYCATFTVAGDIRRDLRAAGFNTRRLPGFGGKKEVLQGVKRVAQSESLLQVVNYKTAWPEHFKKIATLLKKELAEQTELQDQVLNIAHVGSTSVPNLPARAVVDIDIIISSRWALKAVTQKLKALGYDHEKASDHSIFRPQKSAALETIKHQLTVYSIEHQALHQHLLLRDYLRLNPQNAKAYGQLKQSLAKRYPHNHSAYAGAKTKFINQLLSEARKKEL